MARLFSKTKSKAGKTYTCSKCGKPIVPGDKYVEWSFRYGGTYRRHAATCYPEPWEYISNNSKVQAHSRAEDALSTARDSDDPETASSSLADACSEVHEIIDEIESSLDNWQSAGLDRTERYSTWEYAKSDLEDWVNTHEQLVDTIANIETKCQDCDGSGTIGCPDCSDGTIDCESCKGTGEDSDGHACFECDGSGEWSCDICSGQGTVDCDKCNGTGKDESELSDKLGEIDDLPELDLG
jgi:hypothetical protein